MHSQLYIRIMNSARWREIRNRYVSEHPLCEECQRQGIVTPTQCVHHLRAVESGRDEDECKRIAYDIGNLQALCYHCHRLAHGSNKRMTKERTQERLAQWWERRMRYKNNKQENED